MIHYVVRLILLYVLPSIVPPLLIALIAKIGIDHWKHILLILAIVDLALFVPGFLLLGTPFFSMVGKYYLPNNTTFWTWAFSWGVCYAITTMLGTLLALTVAARSRRWGWFSILLIAAIVSISAGVPAYGSLSAYGASAITALFAGRGQFARSYAIYETPLYHTAIWAPVGVTILVQLLYTWLAPQARGNNSTNTSPDETL